METFGRLVMILLAASAVAGLLFRRTLRNNPEIKDAATGGIVNVIKRLLK